MLNWAARFNIFCFLDNGNYAAEQSDFECLLAAGCKRSVTLSPGNAFGSLKDFFDEDPGWLFGHLGYEVNTPGGQSLQDRDAGFADGFFFTPEIILRLAGNELIIETAAEDATAVFRSIEEQEKKVAPFAHPPHIQQQLTKDAYVQIITRIKEHIHRGDCYELNFCQQFFANDAVIDPLAVFKKLSELSPNPFSAFYRVNDNYCICASPERFLKKTGQVLMSQPMKGTSKRATDPVADEANRQYLRASSKEKSENVMVVDLVRNDLSKICLEGSVYVDELFGIYSFPQVHQMISTIKGTLPGDVHFTEALAATFPMGSMTGAPKKRVMELIEQYESGKRGLFSGSIGYITPAADFDFNVVIRSIFYNSSTRYLFFLAGSGITFYSDAVAEYEECLLKAEAIIRALKER